MALISWVELNKSFGKTPVLKDMEGSIEKGDIVILSGPSGSGKSTLLNILGLLESPDSGIIIWWGKDNVKPFSRQAEKLLADKIGYLFQNFALIEDETVEKNLQIALDQVRVRGKEKKALMEKALDQVGLKGFLDRYVYECSGGEQQRIAMARLLLKPCEVILADEPTGSLDEGNKKDIIELMLALNDFGKTLVIATHDPEIKKLATQVIDIPDLKKVSPMEPSP